MSLDQIQPREKAGCPYLSGPNKLEVEWTIFSQSVNEIDRLLPLYLSWHTSHHGLYSNHNLEDLDIPLSSCLFSFKISSRIRMLTIFRWSSEGAACLV